MNLSKLCAGVLIAFVAFAATAALSESRRLDLHNINDKDPFAFTVEARQTAGTVTFTVTITRSETAPSLPTEARVMLFDGEGEIMVLPLEPPLRSTERTKHYRFEVNEKLLAYSQFVFRAFRAKSRAQTDVADSYWFFLRDFASAEAPNQQGGANGSQPSNSETNRTSAAGASRRSP